MDYIKKRAENFARHYIEHQVDEHKKVINEVKSELYEISSDMDKVTFLRVILEVNENEYQKHLKVCTNKDNCPTNYDHESIHYFLTKELDDLGIHLNQDQFTKQEQALADDKLDRIMEEM